MDILPTKQQTSQNNLPTYRGNAEAVSVLIKDCPNEEDFHSKYSLAKTDEYCSIYRSRMILGTAPTLSVVRDAYGEPSILDFLNSFILDLVNFCGLERKTSVSQIDVLSKSILSTYHYLKVTEIMLFFHMIKTGELRDKSGNNVVTFYGSFDGSVITSAFIHFIRYRNAEISKQQEAKAKEHEETWLSAKSTIIAPLLEKMHKDWDIKARALKEKQDREKQRIIDEHNALMRKMYAARQELNEKNY